MAWVAWADLCLGCQALDQESENGKGTKGLRIYLRRAWSVTRDELAKLGG